MRWNYAQIHYKTHPPSIVVEFIQKRNWRVVIANLTFVSLFKTCKCNTERLLQRSWKYLVIFSCTFEIVQLQHLASDVGKYLGLNGNYVINICSVQIVIQTCTLKIKYDVGFNYKRNGTHQLLNIVNKMLNRTKSGFVLNDARQFCFVSNCLKSWKLWFGSRKSFAMNCFHKTMQLLLTTIPSNALTRFQNNSMDFVSRQRQTTKINCEVIIHQLQTI